MPSRLSSLMLALLLCLAGCSGAPESQPADSPEPTPTEVMTPTAEPVTFPDGPKSQPERPEELTEATVREYVRELEYRIGYNALWRGNYSQIRLSCDIKSVTKQGERYEVLVACSGYNQIEPPENSTATQGPVYDYETPPTRYYVSENMTRWTIVNVDRNPR